MFQEGWDHQPVMELGDRLDVLSLVRGTIPHWNMIDQYWPVASRGKPSFDWFDFGSSMAIISPRPRQEPVSKAR